MCIRCVIAVNICNCSTKVRALVLSVPVTSYSLLCLVRYGELYHSRENGCCRFTEFFFVPELMDSLIHTAYARQKSFKVTTDSDKHNSLSGMMEHVDKPTSAKTLIGGEESNELY